MAVCRFGPSDLLGDAAGEKAPLLLEPQQHCLSWTRASQQTLQQRAADATFHKAADAGLQAAHKVRPVPDACRHVMAAHVPPWDVCPSRLQHKKHLLWQRLSIADTDCHAACGTDSSYQMLLTNYAMPCLVPCAMQAYSPYTHCPAAIAFILRTGQVAAGCYLESAAHNPGLAPLQSAVVSGIMSGCLQSYDQVRAVAL
jgi:hypothetical protein